VWPWDPKNPDPENAEWVEPGNTVVVDPDGSILAGPARHEETVLVAELDLTEVRSGRRKFDPVGHYNRPDVFRLSVDTAPHRAVTEMDDGFADS
jgi:nitrilase